MEVAKFAAPPNLEVRFVSCNESAIKRWLSSELEETVFSLTHELFMTKHQTVTLRGGLPSVTRAPLFLEGFQQLLEPAAEAMEYLEYLLTLDVRLKYDL